MTAGEREICAYHEAGHAVSAVVSGMDLRAVVVHAHSDHGIGGYCELRDHDDERDTDAFRFVVYCYSASAAERRAGFTPSPFRAGGDIEQAETMAEAIFGEAAAKTMLASARVQADALMRDPTIWAWVEKCAKALLRRGALTHRDVVELRPRGGTR